MKPIIELDPKNYARHDIHGADRIWAETNCYMDVLIELVHSLGFDPVAALSITIPIDFEIDQWTFFKYAHSDLYDLYGLELQELNPWMTVHEHVQSQVDGGRPVLVELDSFYLPDTSGSAYKIAHVKSTVAVNEIDIANDHMGYFHGQGYYHLDGQDFRDIFQLDGIVTERILPPYIELVKIHKSPGDVDSRTLVSSSLHSLERSVRALPNSNPFHGFKIQFTSDIEWLSEEPIDTFHKYSFATLRQYGACYELAQTYLRWLGDRGEPHAVEIGDIFGKISTMTKAFQFKLARMIARRKTLDLTPLDNMADLWEEATSRLRTMYL